MSDIKPIQNEFVTVKGPYGVINHGDGYAIVIVQTGECIARNISSFLDCVKTIDHLLGTMPPPPPPPPPPNDDKELDRVLQDYKPDIQRLIRKYAPETRRVKKNSNFLGYTWYKCYDDSGKVLGRVRGSSDDRYWQYGGLDSQKHY
jgi:hypothetical protein